MARGKHTCKILKEIRRQIAEANDIEFVVSECKYQGDCKGTCPKCESEVRYLEEQLERRRMLGKAVVVAGLSMNVIAANAVEPVATQCFQQPSKITSVANVIESSVANPTNSVESISYADTASHAYTATGNIVDEEGNPVAGANIRVVGTERGTISKLDGTFELGLDSLPQKLHVSFVGYFPQDITVKADSISNIKVVLTPAVVGMVSAEDLKLYMKHHPNDDMYNIGTVVHRNKLIIKVVDENNNEIDDFDFIIKDGRYRSYYHSKDFKKLADGYKVIYTTLEKRSADYEFQASFHANGYEVKEVKINKDAKPNIISLHKK